jgi:RPA family protein
MAKRRHFIGTLTKVFQGKDDNELAKVMLKDVKGINTKFSGDYIFVTVNKRLSKFINNSITEESTITFSGEIYKYSCDGETKKSIKAISNVEVKDVYDN